MKRKRKARAFVAVVLLGVLAFCGLKIWDGTKAYRNEKDLHRQLLQYKPAPPDQPAVNQGFLDLQSRNGDVAGWLTIPGTRIDYPFVQAADNDFYLHRDMNKEYATAGTLFMDYRCAKDFTSRNTIIYGHHMKNGSMFGTMKKFQDRDFFAAHRTAAIELSDRAYTVELFAFLVIRSDDVKIYDAAPGDDFLAYVKRGTRYYRDIGVTGADRVVTLSTCAYEFDNARMVLVGRLVA